jgi:enoyl-CoA hydratase/carnithine racemase
MREDLLRIEVEAAVAVLRLIRPQKRNALNEEIVERIGARAERVLRAP